jgi:hypothetical protein
MPAAFSTAALMRNGAKGNGPSAGATEGRPWGVPKGLDGTIHKIANPGICSLQIPLIGFWPRRPYSPEHSRGRPRRGLAPDGNLRLVSRGGEFHAATCPMTNILYLLLPFSIAWFGVLLRQAFEMERDRRFQRMWGAIAWSLIPFGASALVWVSQGGSADVSGRNILLGLLGAATGAALAIYLGYVVAPSAPGACAHAGRSVADGPA